jgi:TATA-box binding protein (TBP) (component of TFIID and TFIIIB)
MKIDKDKLINFKLSKNGKFQITGSKYDQHAKECIKYFWEYIRPYSQLYTMDGTYFKVIFITVMTNIDFNLGFIVNREQLDKYMNNSTEHNSLLETSFGYTGVNIKFPAFGYNTNALLPVISYKGNWEDDMISYKTYFENLSEKDQNKIEQKDKYTTFLVFHSGNVIMSGLDKTHMESTFNEFIGIINECKSSIEEKLTV